MAVPKTVSIMLLKAVAGYAKAHDLPPELGWEKLNMSLYTGAENYFLTHTGGVIPLTNWWTFLTASEIPSIHHCAPDPYYDGWGCVACGPAEKTPEEGSTMECNPVAEKTYGPSVTKPIKTYYEEPFNISDGVTAAVAEKTYGPSVTKPIKTYYEEPFNISDGVTTAAAFYHPEPNLSLTLKNIDPIPAIHHHASAAIPTFKISIDHSQGDAEVTAEVSFSQLEFILFSHTSNVGLLPKASKKKFKKGQQVILVLDEDVEMEIPEGVRTAIFG